MKVLCLRRIPPGDRWQDLEDDALMENLTEALNHVFKRESISDFTIHAAQGEVYMHTTEKEPDQVQSFSLYGEN